MHGFSEEHPSFPIWSSGELFIGPAPSLAQEPIQQKIGVPDVVGDDLIVGRDHLHQRTLKLRADLDHQVLVPGIINNGPIHDFGCSRLPTPPRSTADRSKGSRIEASTEPPIHSNHTQFWPRKRVVANRSVSPFQSSKKLVPFDPPVKKIKGRKSLCRPILRSPGSPIYPA